jgi:hypothetical protein
MAIRLSGINAVVGFCGGIDAAGASLGDIATFREHFLPSISSCLSPPVHPVDAHAPGEVKAAARRS